MIENNVHINQHYLYPSSLFVGREHSSITTVLGSCVSVCLYDPSLRMGGMNHFMLPLWNGAGLASPKYGNIAIEKLVKSMFLSQIPVERLIAKVFGGANQSNSSLRIGDRNAAVAFEILEQMKIKVVSYHTGGELGRKVLFDTHSGEVRMKLLKGTSYGQ